MTLFLYVRFIPSSIYQYLMLHIEKLISNSIKRHISEAESEILEKYFRGMHLNIAIK